MKKIGEIMSDLGFRKDAPEATKEAFIKHLIKASGGPDVLTPNERKLAEAKTQAEPEQLSLFNSEAS